MAQTPSSDRMGAFSQPSTFISATYPIPTILPSAAAGHASSFTGKPLKYHLNTTQSSSSNADSSLSPFTTSGVTTIEAFATGANQKFPPRPIPAVFHPINSNISLGSIPYCYGEAPTPTGSLSLGSVFGSTGSSRTINLSPNGPSSHAGPPQCEVPAAITAPGQVEKTLGRIMTHITLPDVPMYNSLFLQWLHARRAWMISQGCNNLLLVGPYVLAHMFDRWIQQWWPLFHSLHIGTPGTNPSSWVSIFDFWFISLFTEHTSSPSPPQTTPTNASATPMDPSQAIAGSCSTCLASQNKKHYRGEMSTLTVQQIQDACTEAGGDADAIQRLAAVFPPGSVITRDALKVGRKPRVGHRGYQEFSRQVNGRWYCQLCRGMGARTWKNEKDILNHVWNEHCDPPALG